MVTKATADILKKLLRLSGGARAVIDKGNEVSQLLDDENFDAIRAMSNEDLNNFAHAALVGYGVALENFLQHGPHTN